MDNANVVVKVLGTAQDAGIPHLNCMCENCLLSYENPNMKRYAASLAIVLPGQQRWHMIDATPDIRDQMVLMNKSYPQIGAVESILLTHAHIGHYPGLMFFGKEGVSAHRLPVYAGEKMEDFLNRNAPWEQLIKLENIQLEPLRHDKMVALDTGIEVTPLEVPHRNEYSETFGFIIEGSAKKLLYIPDIDSWEEWEQDLEKIVSGVDYCLLDATFYSKSELSNTGREISEIPHPLLTHSMDILENTVKQTNTEVYFTHLNHTNAALNPSGEAIKQIQDRGFHVAKEGMEFCLS